jgi:hypothetical protein
MSALAALSRGLDDLGDFPAADKLMSLAMLADDAAAVGEGPAVLSLICDRVHRTDARHAIPLVYLVDMLLKRHAAAFRALFQPRIQWLVATAAARCTDADRERIRRMLGTWAADGIYRDQLPALQDSIPHSHPPPAKRARVEGGLDAGVHPWERAPPPPPQSYPAFAHPPPAYPPAPPHGYYEAAPAAPAGYPGYHYPAYPAPAPYPYPPQPAPAPEPGVGYSYYPPPPAVPMMPTPYQASAPSHAFQPIVPAPTVGSGGPGAFREVGGAVGSGPVASVVAAEASRAVGPSPGRDASPATAPAAAVTAGSTLHKILQSLAGKGKVALPASALAASAGATTPSPTPATVPHGVGYGPEWAAADRDAVRAGRPSRDTQDVSLPTLQLLDELPRVNLYERQRHQCRHCGLRFVDPADLEWHVELHRRTGELPAAPGTAATSALPALGRGIASQMWYGTAPWWETHIPHAEVPPVGAQALALEAARKQAAAAQAKVIPQTPMLPGDASDAVCAGCGERLDKRYQADADAWVFMHAVRLPGEGGAGGLYHTQCAPRAGDA